MSAVGDRVVMYIVILSGTDRFVEMGRENLTSPPHDDELTTMTARLRRLMKVPGRGGQPGQPHQGHVRDPVRPDEPGRPLGLAP